MTVGRRRAPDPWGRQARNRRNGSRNDRAGWPGKEDAAQPMAGIGDSVAANEMGLVPRLAKSRPFIVNYPSGNASSLRSRDLMTTWWRWQSLSQTPITLLSQDLGCQGSSTGTTGAGANTKMLTSTYAFNLTSAPYGRVVPQTTASLEGAGAVAYVTPFYRLVKDSWTNTVGTVNWIWATNPGSYNHPFSASTTSPWQFVKKSDSALSYATPDFRAFKHHYTKLDFNFMGVTNTPVEIELRFVRFRKGCGPPRRTTANALDSANVLTSAPAVAFDTDLGSNTPDRLSEVESFWDRFVSLRSTDVLKAPLATPGKPPFIEISKRVLKICHTSTTDPNTTPCRHFISVIHKDGGIYATDISGKRFDSYQAQVLPVDPNTSNAPTRYAYVADDIASVATVNNLFCNDYEKEVWLLVTGVSEDTVGVSYTRSAKAASFDVIMSGKWTTSI